ncbi:MAG: class I SAM-dependent methyltransferase [Alphaproteobacteria bacterium]|nr:class I SAM-dependent methyltransferase [Alphaproteobacteria bacterium]
MMDNIPQALFDFFEKMPRQGPGSLVLTERLLRTFRSLLPSHPVAADMGCGSGAATLVLARQGISVTGVDVHAPFLEALRHKADQEGLGPLVRTCQSSMLETGLGDESLDLIWSEGAVFTVGFENALQAFWAILKKGGLLGVSDCFLFQEKVPQHVRKQWDEWDPHIKTVADSMKIAERLGYRFLHAERLTPDMWEESYFQPMKRVIASIEADPSASPGLRDIVRANRREIDFFRQNNEYYGYVFHILQKP